MPYKYPTKKGWKVPKQKYKITNWSDYNNALRRRGDIEVWISDEAIEHWYEKDQVRDSTGTPLKYSDFAIQTCHEVRLVFHLPLRQSQGFLDSHFRSKGLSIESPDYTSLSKRLRKLGIKCPCYRNHRLPEEGICAIAIDSTGLKRFGRGEWQQEKYQLEGKRSWRKLHIAVDNNHYIQAAELTLKDISDDQIIDTLVEQIDVPIEQITADGAYDKNPVYEVLSSHFPNAEIVIPPDSDAVYHPKNHELRNLNVLGVAVLGRMQWQQQRHYGQRNKSELGIQRYKRLLGEALRVRAFENQKQEAKIGCGVLNKITALGMPHSYKFA